MQLATAGADILAVDICADFDSTDYPGSTAGDLAETAEQVEALGRRIVTHRADA